MSGNGNAKDKCLEVLHATACEMSGVLPPFISPKLIPPPRFPRKFTMRYLNCIKGEAAVYNRRTVNIQTSFYKVKNILLVNLLYMHQTAVKQNILSNEMQILNLNSNIE